MVSGIMANIHNQARFRPNFWLLIKLIIRVLTVSVFALVCACGNGHNSDSDGDGVPNALDRFPLDGSETNDNDNDGIGDNADSDDDNDGVEDLEDPEPLNAAPDARNLGLLLLNRDDFGAGAEVVIEYEYYDRENDSEGDSKVWFSTRDASMDGPAMQILPTHRGERIAAQVQPLALTGDLVGQVSSLHFEVPEVEGSFRWRLERLTTPGGAQVRYLEGFDGPYGIGVMSDGFIVSDIWDNNIVTFTPQLIFDKWLGLEFLQSSKVTWNESRGRIGRNTEEPIPEFLHGPHASIVDSDGLIWISNFFGKNVVAFDQFGNVAGELHPPSSCLCKFEGPANISRGPGGRFYVSDWVSNRIYVFGKDYNFVGWLGARAGGGVGLHQDGEAVRSDALGGFYRPHMVVFAENGVLLIADQGNNRIQMFDANSLAPLESLDLSVSGVDISLSQPVAVETSGNAVYIVDHGNYRVLKFDLRTKNLTFIGGTDTAPRLEWADISEFIPTAYGESFFKALYDVKVMGSELLVADGHARRIYILSL